MPSTSGGLMVVCLGCKNVVWAYDTMARVDLRGILNHLQMPCRLCGDRGNYDGWYVPDSEANDVWRAMHQIAEHEGYAWKTSPINVWFDDGSPLGIAKKTMVSDLVNAMNGLLQGQCHCGACIEPSLLKAADDAILEANRLMEVGGI